MADVPEDLLAVARRVQANVHVPYSGFAVGAAVRTASGAVYAGCNVENVSYPEGTCAETGAIAAMVRPVSTRSSRCSRSPTVTS